MQTRKVKESKEWQLAIAKQVADSLEHGGKLLVSVTHVSQSNMSYRYKVVLASIKNGEVEFQTLSYWMAACLDKSLMSEYAGDTLRGNGCGFDRFHDAAYTVGCILKSFGLIDDSLSFATHRSYREI